MYLEGEEARVDVIISHTQSQRQLLATVTMATFRSHTYAHSQLNSIKNEGFCCGATGPNVPRFAGRQSRDPFADGRARDTRASALSRVWESLSRGEEVRLTRALCPPLTPASSPAPATTRGRD